jgi:pimeloyl-ACP methyl ester carboxylesterase
VITVKYRSTDVDGFKIFYREAGAVSAPVLLLLHGFPSASHMFRDLIPLLVDRFHLVAPDLPGFGQSDMPPRSTFTYTFDHIAHVIDRFTEVVGFNRFAIYVFDYGAPIGFRIAVKHPDRITAIISQNGNAYEEGLSDGWNPIRAYWRQPSQSNREALRAFLKPEATRWQYTHGVTDETTVSPDGQSLDNFYLARPEAAEIQLDLFGDYKSNIALYPTFQEYFRTYMFFHRQGEFRDRTFENQSFRASGLSLLTTPSSTGTPPTSIRPSGNCAPRASSSPTNCSLMLHRSAGNTSLSPAITSGALHSQLAVCVRYATFPRRSSCAPLSVQF